MKAFFGNIAVCLRGYCYLRQFDGQTFRQIAENAVLNANYVRAALKGKFDAFFDCVCMHECVLSINPAEMNGVHTSDIAKRLLDYGFMRANLMMEVVVPSSLDEMFTVACHAMSLYEK